MKKEQALEKFYRSLHQIHQLENITYLLGWDQQVTMPPEGASSRAEQLELISRLIHERKTNREFLASVESLSDQLDLLEEVDRVNVREMKRILERAAKLPEEFVAKKSRIASQSYSTWAKARTNDDFAAVKPYLQQLVDLSRQESELIGFTGHPYNALLENFEPFVSVSEILPLFDSLEESLKALIPKITSKQQNLQTEAIPISKAEQKELCSWIATIMGYNFQEGRLDSSLHPFCVPICGKDVRITTRFTADNFLPAVFSTIHETGHALYELGLPEEHQGTPRGSSVSLGMHESQSRLWENFIGRSRPFCRFLHRLINQVLPKNEAQVSSESLWSQANCVQASLIRVDADEVTYCLHIIARTHLELALVTGELEVEDLPAAWNERYVEHLGLNPPDNKSGVMQDIHWFEGMFGYFPTYALGTLYAAMLMEKLRNDTPSLDHDVEQGNLGGILSWLRANIHQHGMKYHSLELIKRTTGKELSAKPFLNYLEKKFEV